MTDPRHVSVLLAETLEILEPGPGKRFLDGTFGFGGHTSALLEAGAEVLALDLDETAHRTCLEMGAGRPGLVCRRCSFAEMSAAVAEAGWRGVHGVLLDLGVNSWQLDSPDQGFSYRAAGPLDLRFDQRGGSTAADLIAGLSESELADLLWTFGEERSSRRLARLIVQARNEAPVRTTQDLARIVTGSVKGGRKPEPVLSRVFQALRIAVNGELDALQAALDQLPGLLLPGGRFVVMSYHSLEDRLVKRFIETQRKDCICPPQAPACRCGHRATLKPLTRGALQASDRETQVNPRARSVRLRAAERL